MQPNIVLINCDDLGYGDLGCYGSNINRTPVIDRLAREGMCMTDFYVASPVCSPSRGAMLTGCYPPRIGFGDFDGRGVLFPGQGVGMSSNEVTIATLLKEQGYRTKIIGKWHCGDQTEFLPTRHGFDEYYGLPYSNDMGRQITHESNPPLPLLENETVIQEQPDQTSLTERYVEKATTFIHENKNKPFFLYLAHMHVHLPLYAPARFTKQSTYGDYSACVECLDWATDCIMHQLEQDNLLENTLVIFTSDNGSRGDRGGSNKPLRGNKVTTWEGGQRVPCIFYWKGTIPQGGVCTSIVSSIDFLPTFAKLCNTAPRKNIKIDGKDFGALLKDPNAHFERDTFFYYYMNDLEAVRHGDYKLHLYKNKRPVKLLYNLKTDISETQNLYDTHPEIVKKLEKLVQDCRKDLGDAATSTPASNNRPIGRVQNPKPLTEYNENHPYIITLYDKPDAG